MIAALDKKICTTFVDSGKNEERFARTFWSQIGRNNNKYLEIQLNMFRRDDKAEFHKNQQNKLGESGFKQLLKLRNLIVVATGENSGQENLRPIVTSPLSQDLEEQLKHMQKKTIAIHNCG